MASAHASATSLRELTQRYDAVLLKGQALLLGAVPQQHLAVDVAHLQAGS